MVLYEVEISLVEYYFALGFEIIWFLQSNSYYPKLMNIVTVFMKSFTNYFVHSIIKISYQIVFHISLFSCISFYYQNDLSGIIYVLK